MFRPKVLYRDDERDASARGCRCRSGTPSGRSCSTGGSAACGRPLGDPGLSAWPTEKTSIG
jgi:hypothetical protein